MVVQEEGREPLAAELEEEADTAVGGNTLRRRERESQRERQEVRGGKRALQSKEKQVHSAAFVPQNHQPAR